MKTKEEIEKYLATEKEKIDLADRISEEMGELKWWKVFSPKHRKLFLKYKAVVESFDLSDIDYKHYY